MDIKKLINEILIKKDISQKELAGLLKVSPAQITYYLSGDNYPRRRTLARIQKIYEELEEKKIPPNAHFYFEEARMNFDEFNKEEKK